MKTPSWLGLVGAVALAFSVGPGSASVVLSADPSAAEVADAMAFRQTFGFRDGERFVESTFQDGDTYPDDSWGVPLSRDEAGELDRRIRNRTSQGDAIHYAQAQPDFGGVWIDQPDAGTIHYTFTGDIDAHRDRIMSLAPDGADIVVSKVQNRMSDLQELKERIADDMWTLIDDGYPVTMIDANAKDNEVIIYLDEVTDKATAALQERYGPDVAVARGGAGFPDACNSRSDCRNPLKGGLRITPSGYTGYCTSAFQAVKANGDRVLITAGHCLEAAGGSGHVWTHNGSRFGVSQGNTLTSSSVAADIGWIKIDTTGDLAEDVTPADQFIRSGATYDSFDAQIRDDDQIEGVAICRSGGNSDWDCGTITNADVSKPNGDGQTILHAWVWSKDSKSGDSGGTMVVKYIIGSTTYWFAAGVHVHSVDDHKCEIGQVSCRSWYSTADQVESQAVTGINMTICLTSGC